MSQNVPVAVLVEDDRQIRHFVHISLEREGWQVFDAESFRQGMVEVGTRKPELVILDLGLPDGDGVDFVREIRRWSPVPVIVLSARVNETDKVAALDAGADDYLTKPFGVPELLARVRANMRRQRMITGTPDAIASFGDVRMDMAARLVTKADHAVHLTPIEYRLLALLVANMGRVLTQRQILVEVWGPSYSDRSHYLRVHMRTLRQKLEDDPAQPRHILTEIGVGYRLAP
jgi:two-component system KDP operon response regulator KdpE